MFILFVLVEPSRGVFPKLASASINKATNRMQATPAMASKTGSKFFLRRERKKIIIAEIMQPTPAIIGIINIIICSS
jgi:hypothetical protein